MATKRKVQFSATKNVKKFTKSDYEDGSDLERSDEEETTEKPKAKHTLDSDEEDNTDKYKLLNQECLHDIGQEAKTKEFEGEIKLTAFNMKDELDDGNFDTDGFYHWKSKDKDHVNDAWLDNVEWANVNTFKNKYSLDTQAPADDESETEEKVDLSDNESIHSMEDESNTQMDIFKKILTCLKPGETVLRAIKRLGASSKSNSDTSSKAGLSASQRWLKKKTATETKGPLIDSEQVKQDMQSLEALTGWANHFIDRGYYDVYEETYEKLVFKIGSGASGARMEAKVDPFDMFGEDVGDKEVVAGTSGANSNLVEDSLVKWVYKIENVDEAKIHGPFTSLQMLDMSEKGDFKEAGVWCRKLEDASTVAFYNSKRIDFDLYT